MSLDTFVFSSRGGMQENQDSVLGMTSETGGLFSLADGLGGVQNGAFASQTVTACLQRIWTETSEWNSERLMDSVSKANKEVLVLQSKIGTEARSTVAVLVLQGNCALWGNTGDSRIYYLHENKIGSITKDHSVAYMKYAAGEITREEIAEDPNQSRLLKTLGGEKDWQPDVYEGELQMNDAFLLCSDGFWKYITDEEILIDRLKASSAKEWAFWMLLRITDRLPENCDNLSLIAIVA